MRAVIVACVVFAVGCKDKPQSQQPVAPAPQAAPTTSGSDSPAQGTEVVLPKRTGTPPRTTTKPFDLARGEALAKLDYAGFVKDVRQQDEHSIDVRYRTDTRPTIAITLTVAPCFQCEPMELARWEKHKDALRDLLGRELRDLPDTVFELGKTELAGAPVIYQYQLGYVRGEPGGGGGVTAYSNAYALYYNDGVNMIRVVAEYKDDPPASRDDMVKLVPREDLEKTALAFFDAYTHAW